MPAPKIRNLKTAPHYLWQGDCDGWRLLDEQNLSVIQERMPANRSEVRHRHRLARQLFYCLSGELLIELDDTQYRLSTGDSLQVAPGDAHRVFSGNDNEVHFLVISAPTTAGDRQEFDDAL